MQPLPASGQQRMSFYTFIKTHHNICQRIIGLPFVLVVLPHHAVHIILVVAFALEDLLRERRPAHVTDVSFANIVNSSQSKVNDGCSNVKGGAIFDVTFPLVLGD